MAKSYYDCSNCGEAITVHGRNRREADRYAEYLSKRGDICRDCQRKKWQEENEQAVHDSAGLPELDGTPKQVAWACKIRLQTLPSIDEAVDRILKKDIKSEFNLSEAAFQEVTDALHLIASEIKSETSASEWIDNRDKAADALIIAQWQQRGKNLAPTAWAEIVDPESE